MKYSRLVPHFGLIFCSILTLTACSAPVSGPSQVSTPSDQGSISANRQPQAMASMSPMSPISPIFSNPSVQAPSAIPSTSPSASASEAPNTEDYNRIVENAFLDTLKNPLSTFSIDVDTASYSNLRRFIQQQNQLPPADAVRIEEMINYFHYDYPAPSNDQPFSVNTELSECPWKPGHQLLKIGLQGAPFDRSQAPNSNLVFLLDVSGSMSEPNKLPLLKQSLKLLVEQLQEQDRVSIVVYAGAAGQVLRATSGDQKETILAALDRLEAGGSTAGGAGIELAYQIAQQNFIPGGNNRVILATDGDFNVGASSDSAMERLIESKRQQGVFLTALGFGMGNYKDSKMETLANKGNGNYAYIDSIAEARKVLVNEMGATLNTIAKDVKLQLEFNPAKVASYRLIGYENRLLASEDFNDDSKDAGELGAGHSVTAIYELIPAQESTPLKQDLRFSETQVKESALASKDLLNLKLRYKQPTQNTSQLIEHTLGSTITPWSEASADFHFAASVAGFGMLLRKSEYKGTLNYEQVLQLGQQGKGQDKAGYRAAYLELVNQASRLTGL